MRRFVFLIFFLLLFGQQVFAQENIRYELVHIRTERDMTRHEFALEYNICWEDVHRNSWHTHMNSIIPANVDLYFPPDVMPCYNEAGERLIYYENGRALAVPHYTDRLVYVTQPNETYESMSRTLNLCIDSFFTLNEHLANVTIRTYGDSLSLDSFGLAEGLELFIPDGQPCYSESGHKLLYVDGHDPIELEGTLFYADSYALQTVSLEVNICVEDIQEANTVGIDSWDNLKAAGSIRMTIVVPTDAPTCYDIYREEEYSKEELARHLHICIDYIQEKSNYYVWVNGRAYHRFYVRHDATPCRQPPPPAPPPVWRVLPDGSLVMRTTRNMPIEMIVREFNVCPEVLLEYNDERLFWGGYHEIVIPQTPPCYDEDGYKLIYPEDDGEPIRAPLPSTIISRSTSFSSFLRGNDICMDAVLAANPHLNEGDELFWGTNDVYYGFNNEVLLIRIGTEVFMPESDPSCYEEYTRNANESEYVLARELNICIEQLHLWGNHSFEGSVYEIPIEREACYDENGHRLSYYNAEGYIGREPQRSLLDVYHVPDYMSTIELSRRLNVCMDDLVDVNPNLTRMLLSPELEVFVPDTRPCYDEATGRPLIYEDEYGNPLSEPQLGDYIVYRVRRGSAWGTVGMMFNVCPNRLKDFNEGFLPNVWTFDHWDVPMRIADGYGFFDVGVYVRIPLDRPPCFKYGVDNGWGMSSLRYVCYDTPIDMSKENPDAMINPDGTHCYNIEDENTVIWHAGDRYLYQVRKGLIRNDFMAWCFGVSSEDILAEAENSIVYIIPYEELLVRNPTRPCYIRDDDGAETVHWVESGETLRDMGWQYGKLPSWIADVNNLADPNLIWEGQRLVIPEGINLWHVLYAFPAIGIFLLTVRYLFKRRQGITDMKKKRKPSEV